MKKLLFPLLIAGASLNAQKIEIAASYGTPSVYGTAYDLGSAIVGSLSDTKSPSSNGVAALGVMVYSKNMNWRYGIDVTNEFFGKTESVSKQSITSILPKVDYFWLRKNKLGLYSGGSIGVNFTSTTYVNKNNKKENKDSSTGFGFNVVPIGLRYGGDLSVFVETNIGMKGIAQAGVAYRF
ncbi:hypothetical protein QWZ06_21225 [Chryseobacterium tructae]|uniref:Outer membrane protein beta-barrel domain-containing protein n=1 Tax=Chryseobacterium tructae TaxID=1037380 RepID=A0ABV7Y5H0_9FLAO|nr:hypothetical protein [Chryseobacterium tructae]MDN3694610.1 hypothetical protein [Chryseobacterium tructae]